MKKRLLKLFYLFAPIFLVVFGWPQFSQAATLLISPGTGTFHQGDNFSAHVYIKSADKAVNAVSATLSFPSDRLEIRSISKSSSIINFWVDEPKFNNQSGAASFSGLVMAPGFTGNSGRVVTLDFRVKKAGTADLRLNKASVLANDGEGTNILQSTGVARFSLVGEEPEAPQNTENSLNKAIVAKVSVDVQSQPQVEIEKKIQTSNQDYQPVVITQLSSSTVVAEVTTTPTNADVKINKIPPSVSQPVDWGEQKNIKISWVLFILLLIILGSFGLYLFNWIGILSKLDSIDLFYRRIYKQLDKVVHTFEKTRLKRQLSKDEEKLLLMIVRLQEFYIDHLEKKSKK